METIPHDVETTLLRALVWAGLAVTEQEKETAWKWVEDHSDPNREEMGG